MTRRIRFRPAPTPRRTDEQIRASINRAVTEMNNYNPASQYRLPEELQPREREPVYEIESPLPDNHPLVQARNNMVEGRPRYQVREGIGPMIGFGPGQTTAMYGATGYGRSIHGRILPSMSEGERMRDEQHRTFYNPKFYEVDPDQVKNTMDMVKVFRAMLSKITLDEETVRKYGLEHYVKEK